MPGAIHRASFRDAGAFGLNTEEALAVQDPRWLTEGLNLVYDDSGRLTSRKGLTAVTTTGAHSAETESIAEYIKDATTTEIISAGGAKIYSGTTSLTDITGTASPTANDWQFVSFNGKSIGVQQAHTAIVYTGTSFAPITAASGSVPQGNCALAAFGRLWIAGSDRTTLNFSDSLDETNWANAGSGSLNTLTVWPDGIDIITALAEFQGQLLIFGRRSILVYTGAEDPTASTFALTDIIRKGTHWRDSVVAAGRDLLFLSDDGVRSVSRGLASQNMPMTELTTQVRSELISHMTSATKAQAGYSPVDRAYLLRVTTADSSFYWYFDLGQRLEGGDLRAMQWSGIGWQSIVVADDEIVYFGMTGKVATHSGYQDDGAGYSAAWLAAGSDLGIDGEKLAKSARIQIGATSAATVRVRWKFDFLGDEHSASSATGTSDTASEWNIAEWGLDEWSGLVTQTGIVHVPMFSSGHIIQIGGSVTVNGFQISFSNPEFFFKSARLAA